jgi:hypothetical protein
MSFLRERRVSLEATKVVPKGAQSKSRSSKVIPKGMQSQNTTEIEGEEAPKSFLRGCRVLCVPVWACMRVCSALTSYCIISSHHSA